KTNYIPLCFIMAKCGHVQPKMYNYAVKYSMYSQIWHARQVRQVLPSIAKLINYDTVRAFMIQYGQLWLNVAKCCLIMASCDQLCSIVIKI
ncbi:hypothetical protein HN011_003379, partial [Eciton burchellii]